MKFEDVRKGYRNLWEKAEIRPEYLSAAKRAAASISAFRNTYSGIIPSIPWYFIGIIHHLESGGNFRSHLHNGDPLSARTKNVPAGRPASGQPPFTWSESAFDALTMKGLDKITSWPIERILYELERYNGFGYFSKGVNSPYLWSMTNLYSRGKYVSDGKYDPSAVSKQVGAAAILKILLADQGTDDMEKLQATLSPFRAMVPFLVSLPIDLALRIIAEKLDVNPTVDEVGKKIETSPIGAVMDALRSANDFAREIAPAVQDPPIEPDPVTPPVKNPVDSAVPALEGWKSVIGIILMGGLTALNALGYVPTDIYTFGMSIGATIFGVGVVAKVDRYFGWMKKK